MQMKKASSRAHGEDAQDPITKAAVMNPTAMNNYMANANACQILAPMRGSPQYWSAAARDLVSMIRQLGPCSFFRKSSFFYFAVPY